MWSLRSLLGLLATKTTQGCVFWAKSKIRLKNWVTWIFRFQKYCPISSLGKGNRREERILKKNDFPSISDYLQCRPQSIKMPASKIQQNVYKWKENKREEKDTGREKGVAHKRIVGMQSGYLLGSKKYRNTPYFGGSGYGISNGAIEIFLGDHDTRFRNCIGTRNYNILIGIWGNYRMIKKIVNNGIRGTPMTYNRLSRARIWYNLLASGSRLPSSRSNCTGTVHILGAKMNKIV